MHAGEQVVDAVGDRLPHAGQRAGNFRHSRTDVGENFRSRADRGGEFEFDLCGVHLHHMLIALGAAGAAPDGADFGDFAQELLCDASEAGAFLERGSRGADDEHCRAALVEWREKFASQKRHEGHCAKKRHQDKREEGFGNPEADGEHTGDETFEKPHQEAVLGMRHLFHIRQKIGAERGGDSDGDKETGGDRDDVGQTQRRENPAFDAVQCEEGNENQDDDEGGEDDRVPHLAAG